MQKKRSSGYYRSFHKKKKLAVFRNLVRKNCLSVCLFICNLFSFIPYSFQHMATEDDERTPLISPNLESSQESMKRTYHVYGTMLGFLFFFCCVIHWYRSLLPTPLSDAQANEMDDFSGIHAYNMYLSHFTAPHPSNSRENAVMKNWLGSVATELQQEAASRGLKVDVIANDSSRDIIPQKWFSQGNLTKNIMKTCKIK